MRKSSLPLMLLPAIALGIYGVWTARQPRVIRKPGLYIEKVESMPLTPRDASRGYDGMARVVLNYAGSKPAWWGTEIPSTWQISPRRILESVPQVPGLLIAAPQQRKRPGAVAGRLPGTFLIGIGHFTMRNGQPVFAGTNADVLPGKATWTKPRFWNSGQYIFNVIYRTEARLDRIQPLQLWVAARINDAALSEAVRSMPLDGARAVPDKIRRSDVQILRTRVHRSVPSDRFNRSAWEIEIDAQYNGTLQPRRGYRWPWYAGEGVIVDSAGNVGKSTSRDISPTNVSSSSETVAPSTATVKFRFGEQKFARGELVFKCRVGMGDGWTEPVRLVVRPRSEPVLRSSTVRIVGREVRPAVGREAYWSDAVVELLVKSPRGADDQKRWIVHYSQHLLLNARKELWRTPARKKGRNVLAEILADVPRWDSARNLWQVRYIFYIKQVPAGHVMLKAKLGLKGEELVPVDVLVRR